MRSYCYVGVDYYCVGAVNNYVGVYYCTVGVVISNGGVWWNVGNACAVVFFFLANSPWYPVMRFVAACRNGRQCWRKKTLTQTDGLPASVGIVCWLSAIIAL